MGTVTKSIGSAGGRDYSTIAAWEAALPANLVTDGNAQVGECYNDSEFTVTASITFSGSTTDSTNYIRLTCATGQSFRDNASVQTNALRYNVSNGVGVRKTNAYSPVITISEDNVQISGLQIAHTGAGNSATAYDNNTSTFHGTVLDFCICDVQTTVSGGIVRQRSGKIRNCLIITRTSTTGTAGLTFNYVGSPTTTCVNVTVVRPSDFTAGTNAYTASNGVTALVNCAAFGFTNEVNVSTRFTATTCATDKASPMSGFTGSLTYSSQFETVTDATRDFRLKSGSGLIDTGTTDSTNAAIDIAGTSRPQGSAYDIGCWELVAAAAAGFIGIMPNRKLMPHLLR